MNQTHEQRLEAEIHRELKCLPLLPAPPTLIARVMAAIDRKVVVPWFHRSWQTWPGALQIGSLTLLLAMFAGLCFAGWEVSQLGSPVVTQKFAGLFSGLSTAWGAVSALFSAVGVVANKLGNGFLIGCALAAALGYAFFVAVGTVYVRLALARR